MNSPQPTPDTPTVHAGCARLMAGVPRGRGFGLPTGLRTTGGLPFGIGAPRVDSLTQRADELPAGQRAA